MVPFLILILGGGLLIEAAIHNHNPLDPLITRLGGSPAPWSATPEPPSGGGTGGGGTGGGGGPPMPGGGSNAAWQKQYGNVAANIALCTQVIQQMVAWAPGLWHSLPVVVCRPMKGSGAGSCAGRCYSVHSVAGAVDFEPGTTGLSLDQINAFALTLPQTVLTVIDNHPDGTPWDVHVQVIPNPPDVTTWVPPCAGGSSVQQSQQPGNQGLRLRVGSMSGTPGRP